MSVNGGCDGRRMAENDGEDSEDEIKVFNLLKFCTFPFLTNPAVILFLVCHLLPYFSFSLPYEDLFNLSLQWLLRACLVFALQKLVFQRQMVLENSNSPHRISVSVQSCFLVFSCYIYFSPLLLLRGKLQTPKLSLNN